MRRPAMTETAFVIAVPAALAAGCAVYAAVEHWWERRQPRRGVEVVDRRKFEQALRLVDAERREIAALEERCAAAEAALEDERCPRSDDEATVLRLERWLAEHQ